MGTLTNAIRRTTRRETRVLVKLTLPLAERDRLDMSARRRGESRAAVVREAVGLWCSLEGQRPGRA